MRLVSVMYTALSTALLSLLLVSTAVSPVAAQAEEPVVHAVMFWMDSCSHCHDVLDNVLPQLQQQYGRQLEIHLVEVNTAEEFDRLLSIAEAAGIPPSRVGVPFLLIGDAVLIGADQIPAELSGLIETYLATGGVAYPDNPGLESFLPQAPACPLAAPCSGAPRFPPPAGTATIPAITLATPESVPADSVATAAEPIATTIERATATAASGFVLVIAILAGMVVALAYGGLKLALARRGRIWLPHPRWTETAVPVLAVVGLGVAAYLAYVETQAVTAVCGPIGDCNAVQTSEYATLFGIPIGVLGVAGYLAILLTWLWGQWQANQHVPLVLLGITGFGVLFSVYLTYLEPFVIGAVCAWCLASAVIMTLLMLIALGPAVREMQLVANRDSKARR